jgi:hypothetical protein
LFVWLQVMSERDTVHKEIEQLQDKLSEMGKLSDKYRQDKLAAEKDLERLQGELAAATATREKLRQESEIRSQLEAEKRDLKRELQVRKKNENNNRTMTLQQ